MDKRKQSKTQFYSDQARFYFGVVAGLEIVYPDLVGGITHQSLHLSLGPLTQTIDRDKVLYYQEDVLDWVKGCLAHFKVKFNVTSGEIEDGSSSST